MIHGHWSWWWKRFFIHQTGILLAGDNGKRSEIYIVGGERPMTKMHLVHTIADTLGVRHPKLKIPQRLAWPAASILEFLGRKFHIEPVLTVDGS